MSDRNDYDALISVLVAVDDVVPAAPDFPLTDVERRHRSRWSRPVAVSAGALAAVLLVVAAATTMLSSGRVEASSFLAGTPSDDYRLVVVFFDVGAIPDDVLEEIESRPEVADAVALTREEAATEALQAFEEELGDILREDPYILPAQVRIAAHASSDIDELVVFLDGLQVLGVGPAAVRVPEPGVLDDLLVVPEVISEKP